MRNIVEPAPRQHKLMIPLIAALAVVLTVGLFSVLEHKFGADPAAYFGAALSFSIVVAIGKLFRPHLGD